MEALSILIFRYILKEVVPQFFSALIVICAVIIVSQLVRLSEVLITFGLSLENVFLPFLYIMLPFLSLTIPMAYLFAVVLCFSRLSSDGEYAALLAAGYALKRSAIPILLFGGILYGVSTICALNLEAWGRRELVQFLYKKTQTELDNMLRYKLQAGVFMNNFLGYVFYAEHISTDKKKFRNVLLAPGANNLDENFTLLAPRGEIRGSVETGKLWLNLDFGWAYSLRENSDKSSVVKFKSAELDLLRMFQEQILGPDTKEDDFRSFPPGKLWAFVEGLRVNPNRDESTYLRARYLLHQRIGASFSVVTFALFGIFLGVNDPRRGKSKAYLGAIATIIIGYVMMMGFKWLSENAYLSAPFATWVPNVILLLIGGFFLYQKNRLPPSESILDLANLPFIRR
jgi:lipopolysaccharide export system permease protein